MSRRLTKTRCFAFDIDDIPSSSILSGKKQASTERISQMNDKYGVDVYDIDLLSEQFKDANMRNQVRGSWNTPEKIRGVDTDEETISKSSKSTLVPFPSVWKRMPLFLS